MSNFYKTHMDLGFGRLLDIQCRLLVFECSVRVKRVSAHLRRLVATDEICVHLSCVGDLANMSIICVNAPCTHFFVVSIVSIFRLFLCWFFIFLLPSPRRQSLHWIVSECIFDGGGGGDEKRKLPKTKNKPFKKILKTTTTKKHTHNMRKIKIQRKWRWWLLELLMYNNVDNI